MPTAWCCRRLPARPVWGRNIPGLIFFLFLWCAPGYTAPLGAPTSLPELRTYARLRASVLAAEEFTRALDAVIAVHGPQDLRQFSPREAARRLQDGGWIDPGLPFSFDETPLELTSTQRFVSALDPTLTSADLPLLELPAELIGPALEDESAAVRWFILQSLARYPGQGEQARNLLTALAREPESALVRAYAAALSRVPLARRLPELLREEDFSDTWRALLVRTDMDARCLGLLLCAPAPGGCPTPSSTDKPDAATLILAQLERNYPVATVEMVVRSLPLPVLDRLCHGLRHAWADPQDRLVALLARFPEHGPALEALAHALLNRNHPAYSASHRMLIQVWEQRTGIPFQGSAEPFLQWYHAHKPMPKLP